MESIIGKFNRSVEKYSMIKKGVIACVSGGADSVCMLYLLNDYCVNNCLDIICAHFNHKLRGEDSEADVDFVKKLCDKLNIKFIYKETDIYKMSKELNTGIEETARRARYSFFNEIASYYGYTIAVAHNRNDRYETVIHNIFRGTSIEGLKGISYIRDNIIRPMLDIYRYEIEEYLKQNNIDYRTDKSNYDTNYTRNKIRHEVIPYLDSKFGNTIDQVLRLSDLSINDNDYLNEVADKHFTDVCEIKEKIRIYVIEYKNLHIAIRSRILKKALSLVQNDKSEFIFNAGTGIDYSMLERIDNFIINGVSGKYTEASKSVIAKKEFDYVYLSYGIDESHKNMCSLKTEIINIKDFSKNFEDDTSACFDYDVIKKLQYVLRTRKEGDIFKPYGFKGSKKLKKFLIDNKIPVSERDNLILLACGNNILWIPGIRKSSIAAIDNNTENVIIFRLQKN